MLFKRGALDLVCRTETMLDRRSGADATKLCLHHRAQVAGCMVAEFDYLAWFTVEDDDLFARLIWLQRLP